MFERVYSIYQKKNGPKELLSSSRKERVTQSVKKRMVKRGYLIHQEKKGLLNLSQKEWEKEFVNRFL